MGVAVAASSPCPCADRAAEASETVDRGEMLVTAMAPAATMVGAAASQGRTFLLFGAMPTIPPCTKPGRLRLGGAVGDGPQAPMGSHRSRITPRSHEGDSSANLIINMAKQGHYGYETLRNLVQPLVELFQLRGARMRGQPGPRIRV